MIKLFSHITLSTLMLLTATSLTINLHYCEGQLYDFALIVPTHDCCEDVAHENHCNHEGEMDNSNHCDDKTINFESTSNYVVSAFSFDFESIFSELSTSIIRCGFEWATIVSPRFITKAYSKPSRFNFFILLITS